MGPWRRPLVVAVAFVIAAGNFLALAQAGLYEFFNPDDSTNMFVAAKRPLADSVRQCVFFWQGSVRPVGELAYGLLYRCFGWHPWPFRAFCFAVLILNLLLVCWFLAELSESDEFLLIGALLVSFHGGLWSIYASTGTIFDVLCETFILTGLLLYVRVRRTGAISPLWLALVLPALTVAAFESKETGFMLPALLLAYELCFAWDPSAPKRTFSWALRAIMPAGIVGIVGLLGLRLGGAQVDFTMPEYTPSVRWDRLLETNQSYLSMLLFRSMHLSGLTCVLALAVAGGLALLLRSRRMVFGWLFYNLALIPLWFVPPRHDGYVLYVPYVGAVVYIAALFDLLLSARGVSRVARWALLAVILAGIVGVQNLERSKTSRKGFGPGGMWWIRELTTYAENHCATWTPGQKLVVVNNPFGSDWQAAFVFNLTCHRTDVVVLPVASQDPKSLLSQYPEIINYNGVGYQLLKAR